MYITVVYLMDTRFWLTSFDLGGIGGGGEGVCLGGRQGIFLPLGGGEGTFPMIRGGREGGLVESDSQSATSN